MSGWLFKGYKVKPISLFFFNHTRRFNHAGEDRQTNDTTTLERQRALPVEP